MSLSPQEIAPLLGGTGGIGTFIGVWLARRNAVNERRIREALVQDEILGHKGIQGVADKRGISERLAAIELIGNQNSRELHPNGGNSLADRVNALDSAVREHAQLDAEHWRIITDHFIELPKEST